MSKLRKVKKNSRLGMTGIGRTLIFLGAVSTSVLGYAQQTPLDKSLGSQVEDGVTSIFRDMGVVQKRAMPKAGRFLFYNSMAFDFSDGPYSMYALNVNPGYAFSDFFEIYLNYVPYFLHRPRKIVSTVDAYNTNNDLYRKRSDGSCSGGSPGAECFDPIDIAIDAVAPKMQIGLELIWAPLYGKDSLGMRSIIRSDTFFKLGFAQITFDNAAKDKGYKTHFGVGKTFFLNSWLGLRAVVEGSYQASIITAGDVGGTPTTSGLSYGLFAFIEGGLVIYL